MTQPPDPGSSGRFIGLVFMTIGVIWIALTGLCSLSLAAMLLEEGTDSREFGTIFIVAVPSAILGLGAFIFGRLMRPKRETTKP